MQVKQKERVAPQRKISLLGHGAPALARVADACRDVVQDRCFSLSVQKNPVWDIRATAPTVRHGKGYGAGDIPQTTEDVEFGLEDIRKGLKSGIYQEVSSDHARRAKDAGAVIFW